MPSVPSVRPANIQLGNLGAAVEFADKAYSPVGYGGYGGGWYQISSPLIAEEPFTGAWQRNMELRGQSVLGYNAVYACVTRISSDGAKLPLLLVQRDSNGIWVETESAAFSPVLREPNGFQVTGQFIEQWLFSRLITGNTYVYLERDNRGVVVGMYVLDPRTTKPYVTRDGEIYYQVARDNLAGFLRDDNRLPARDIIHDRMNPMYHPLCGISPLSAAGISAVQGLAIQQQSTGFFQNRAMPSLFLSAPGNIDDTTAARLKEYFQREFSGLNSGKVAVAGSGLEAKPLTMTAVDAAVIEQLKLTAEQVCSCYSVPPFMVGFGEVPKYDNIEAQIRLYYSQGLQQHLKRIEDLLDRALGLTQPKDGVRYGTMFDLDALFDMDSATLMKTMTEGVRGMVLAPNEGRRKLNLPPVTGGDVPFGQHQQYPLDILADRDRPLPGETAAAAPSASAAPEEEDDEDPEADAIRAAWMFERHMERLAA